MYLEKSFELGLFALRVHPGAHVFDDSGFLAPLDDGVTELAEQEVPVHHREVVRKLMMDVVDAPMDSRHCPALLLDYTFRPCC